MKSRYVFGVSAAVAALVTNFGASAAPANAQELAAGVSCDNFSCRNDTDDIYRVESIVTCWALSGFPTHTNVAATTYIPARGTARVVVACPMVSEQGGFQPQPPDSDGKIQPPVWQPGGSTQSSPVSVEHLSAVVDNDPPRPPTGSA